MSGVPYTFGNATTTIALSNLDTNFATPVTIGNTTVGLGNTTTTLAGLSNVSTTVTNTSNVASNGSLLLQTNGTTTAVTVDANQNIGIGCTPNGSTTTGVKTLEIGSQSGHGLIGWNSSNEIDVASNVYVDGSGNYKYANTAASSLYYQTAGAHNWLYAASGSANSAITFTTGMKLDTSGNLLVGTTTNIRASKLVVGGTFGGGTGVEIDNTSNQSWIGLAWHTAGSLAGYVNVGTSTVSLVNGSDYRIKHNVQPMTDGLLKINSLKPVTFNWNIDESLGQGFIAHELQEIIPIAVFGEKDAVDEKGKIVPQGVDITAIIPHLVKAIQELSSQVTALQATVTALQAKVGV